MIIIISETDSMTKAEHILIRFNSVEIHSFSSVVEIEVPAMVGRFYKQ